MTLRSALPNTHLPRTRLHARDYCPSALAFFIACAFAALAYHTLYSGPHSDKSAMTVQAAVGALAFLTGLGWLSFSWVPGNGGTRDIIVPWLVVGGLLTASGSMGGTDSITATTLLHNVKIAAIVLLPFVIGLTLMTRLHAPTDLCSASSAIGFCAGGFALLVLAPLMNVAGTAAVLGLCGIIIGGTMAFCRITLCHLIKW